MYDFTCVVNEVNLVLTRTPSNHVDLFVCVYLLRSK